MRTSKKIRITTLHKNELDARRMNHLKGGGDRKKDEDICTECNCGTVSPPNSNSKDIMHNA